jgi:hypothetical protein
LSARALYGKFFILASLFLGNMNFVCVVDLLGARA